MLKNKYLKLALLFFLLIFSVYFIKKSFFKESSSFVKRRTQIKNLSETHFNWTVKDIYGEKIIISPRLKARFVVVHLWATWCAPCIEELPLLAELAKETHPQTLVLAVTTESLKKTTKFIQKAFSDLSSHLKIVSVSKEERSQFFPEDVLPVTYIFNEERKLIRKEIGPKDWVALIPYFKKARVTKRK